MKKAWLKIQKCNCLIISWQQNVWAYCRGQWKADQPTRPLHSRKRGPKRLLLLQSKGTCTFLSVLYFCLNVIKDHLITVYSVFSLFNWFSLLCNFSSRFSLWPSPLPTSPKLCVGPTWKVPSLRLRGDLTFPALVWASLMEVLKWVCIRIPQWLNY